MPERSSPPDHAASRRLTRLFCLELDEFCTCTSADAITFARLRRAGGAIPPREGTVRAGRSCAYRGHFPTRLASLATLPSRGGIGPPVWPTAAPLIDSYPIAAFTRPASSGRS